MNKLDPNNFYQKADNLVCRAIENELIIVPIDSGIGDLDSELFSLNTTGLSVWDKLDGSKTLKETIEDIANEYQAPIEQIEADILNLVGQLLKKKLIKEK